MATSVAKTEKKKTLKEILFAKRGKKIQQIDIIIFTRNLCTMLEAGLPIVQSFEILERGEENENMKNLLASIKAGIIGGNTLAESCAKHPEYFDKLFCGLIGAGEASGTLTTMLKRITTYMERSYYLKKKIKKASIYPIIVMSVAAGVSAILLLFIVPKFQTMFKSFGKDLPAFTQYVVDLSNFLRSYWWAIIGSIVGATWYYKHKVKTSPSFVEKVDNFLLRRRVIGPLLRKIIIARYSRILSTTLASGMPITDAIQSAVVIMKPGLFKNAIIKIKEDISAGESLHQAMDKSKLFPVLVIQMVAVGEESGSLEAMLTKVAVYYEDEVDSAVDNLNSMLEPLIMIVLGVVIGGFVAAMYLPIFRLGTAL